jgi:hypothetical protein
MALATALTRARRVPSPHGEPAPARAGGPIVSANIASTVALAREHLIRSSARVRRV